MPYILSDLVENPAAVEYLELFLVLQEIVDIVFAPRVTDSLLFHFSKLLEQFFTLFKQAYPNLSIIPKMHFLVHYPSIIKKNGPTKNYWCMNYERMNGAVKVPSHVMKNFRDPQKTLAYRRQCATLNALLEKRNNRDFILI